ncbi:MAG: helix-turn-helix domain-containing protein [Reyranellaceae bacterium]
MPDQVDWRAIEREASSGRAVGRLLRDQREARGLALTDIEKALRIRRANLEAIEEGSFDKLPGAAYVPAFLRAYASHVGLDPDKVLSAYHHSGAVPIKRPVALPADFPIAERRAPIGLAVLTVLLFVAAGYAAWHYLPREQVVVAEKVPPVPDRLLASRPDAVPAGNVPPSTPSAPAPAANNVTSSQPSREARNAPPAQPAELWPAMRRDSVAPPTQPESQPAPLAPPVVIAVPAPPAVMTVPAIGQAQAAQPPIQVETPKPATSPPAVEEATAKPTPPDPATTNIPVKVDTPVRVRANSWVELRSPTGDVLAQTYVRAGESYTVPAGIAYRVIDAR